MTARRLFHILWYATDVVLVLSLLCLIYGAVWEYSTTSYLKGFSDAVVPASGTDDAKIEAILSWMEHGPARHSTLPSSPLSARNPEDTLNYQGLLDVCGSATNAFVNLAESSGLQARRLLLLDPQLNTKHVVAEVQVAGRWIVVDPSYRLIFRDAQGQPLTREQLTQAASGKLVGDKRPAHEGSALTGHRGLHDCCRRVDPERRPAIPWAGSNM